MNKTLDPYSIEAQMNAKLSSEWYDHIANTITKCPFCDLKAKYFVIEGTHCVLTVNLFPYEDGHLMVIPKRHIEKIAQISQEETLETQDLISKGIKLLKTEFNYASINVLYREGGEKAGQSLLHIHTHILPVDRILNYRQGGFDFNFQKIKYPPIETAQKLRKLAKELF